MSQQESEIQTEPCPCCCRRTGSPMAQAWLPSLAEKSLGMVKNGSGGHDTVQYEGHFVTSSESTSIDR
jgi:hypothetical protein